MIAQRRIQTSATGTLIQNTMDQSKVWTAQPPTKSPIGAPMPAIAAHIPMAFGRSSGGKTVTTIDSVDGIIIAAPSPMTARAAMTSPLVSAYIAVQADAVQTMRRPTCKAERRPNRSPIAPIVSSAPPKTSA